MILKNLVRAVLMDSLFLLAWDVCSQRSVLSLHAAAMSQTAEDGAMGIIKGMMDPDAESGVHYGPEKTKGPAVINPEKPYEVDPEAIKMLWETSQAATGVVFEI